MPETDAEFLVCLGSAQDDLLVRERVLRIARDLMRFELAGALCDGVNPTAFGTLMSGRHSAQREER